MLRIEFSTSDVDLNKCSTRPQDIIEFALKNYAPKLSQIEKWPDRYPQNDDFEIFVRSLRTLVRMSMFPPG